MRDNYDFSDSIPNPYTEIKTTPALPDKIHKKPCNYLTLKQKPKLLYWRCKS
jgi:hypothetical protein